jgi:hypothetical protein
MQKVGLYPIISSDNFYDDLINLNKFFRIAGAIILINVTCLELGWPPNLLSGPARVRNPLLPVGIRPLLGIIMVGLVFCPGCTSDLR